jgi:hypothetical protein
MKILSKILLTSTFLFLLSACKTEKNYITNTTGPTDWQPPEVSWVTPPESQLRGTVGVDISVADSSRIARTVLYFDGRVADSLIAAPWRFTLQTDSVAVGVHLLEARAWDEFGNMGVSPILRVYAAGGIPEGIRLLWVPDDFSRIQDAINAAQDFDTIRVRDGIYYETLNTFGKGIWIESEHGPTRCEINAASSSRVFAVSPNATICTIRGFKLTGGNYLISLDYSMANLYNNFFIADTAEALLISSYSGGEICNNFYNGARFGVEIGYHWGAFFNNIMQNMQNTAMWNATSLRNPLVYGYNLFWNNENNYNGFESGVGDIYAEPQIDLVNGILLASSPAIDSGNPEISDRNNSKSDIGPFGGPYAY